MLPAIAPPEALQSAPIFFFRARDRGSAISPSRHSVSCVYPLKTLGWRTMRAFGFGASLALTVRACIALARRRHRRTFRLRVRALLSSGGDVLPCAPPAPGNGTNPRSPPWDTAARSDTVPPASRLRPAAVCARRECWRSPPWFPAQLPPAVSSVRSHAARMNPARCASRNSFSAYEQTTKSHAPSGRFAVSAVRSPCSQLVSRQR